MALELSQSHGDGKLMIRAKGEVDLYSSPDLRTMVTKAVARADGAVYLDLREVEYMDSSGVATLVEGLRAAMDRKLSFILIAPSQPVLKVLQLSRLDSVFTIRDQP